MNKILPTWEWQFSRALYIQQNNCTTAYPKKVSVQGHGKWDTGVEMGPIEQPLLCGNVTKAESSSNNRPTSNGSKRLQSKGLHRLAPLRGQETTTHAKRQASLVNNTSSSSSPRPKSEIANKERSLLVALNSCQTVCHGQMISVASLLSGGILICTNMGFLFWYICL